MVAPPNASVEAIESLNVAAKIAFYHEICINIFTNRQYFGIA